MQKQLKWYWIGLIMRTNDNRGTKRTTEEIPYGNKQKGGKPRTYEMM